MLLRERYRPTTPGLSLRTKACFLIANCGDRMNKDTPAEPLPTISPAPDPTRRTTLYLLMAATVTALLEIPILRGVRAR